MGSPVNVGTNTYLLNLTPFTYSILKSNIDNSMPPRRRSQHGNVEVIIEQNKIVGPHLTHQFWDMAKALNQEITCAICLEDWLDCKRCAIILRCGHCYHSTCYLASDDDRCAICRE